MYAQIPALIGQAVQYFQQGDLPRATALLDQVLAAQPRNFDALHILGVIQAMQGKRAAAIELFRKALSLNKNHSFLQFNMAKALSESDQDAEALVHHKRATQLAPDHAEAWLNYGQSLLKLEHHQEAVGAFERATTINPLYAAAWSNLGLAWSKLGRTTDAFAALNRAIALQADLAQAHYNLGCMLDELQRGEEALASYDRALQFKPDYAEAWNNKGITLADLHRHAQALACYERAAALNPSYAQAWNNKAGSLLALGQMDDAIVAYQQALAIQPDYADAQVNLGHLLLQKGDFPDAWEKCEFRWQVKKDAPRPLPTQRPRWTGAPSNRPVLLWGEQGIGDQILYSSILPDLATFPQRKLVALDRRLIPLFARSLPGFEFIDLAQASDSLDFAEQLPLGSLPRYFRPSRESFAAARHPFLVADPARVTALREKIARPGQLICGVSWSSNRNVIGKHKSIGLEQMLSALASDKLHFVDLQYGDTRAERQALQDKHGIAVQHLDEIDNFNDIDGLAALIAACDVVISTSNSTVHLAGALGKATLLLLPSGKSKIWYWSEFDGRNLWYPTIQSFSQTEPGQWQQALALLKQHLEGKTWN